MVRMKLKNFESGKVIEDRVRAGDEIDVVLTETRTATYLYNDGASAHFMDTENFDQIELPTERVEEQLNWVRENDTVTLLLQDNGVPWGGSEDYREDVAGMVKALKLASLSDRLNKIIATIETEF
jgi:hypothetical protein